MTESIADIRRRNNTFKEDVVGSSTILRASYSVNILTEMGSYDSVRSLTSGEITVVNEMKAAIEKKINLQFKEF
jgi:hypothetical protein